MRLLPWEYAVRNLARSPWRLTLAVAGSALVVLLVLGAAAFVHGMGRSFEVSGGENNVILLGAGSEDSVERSEIGAGVAGIAAASIPGVRERMGVLYVSPEVHMASMVRLDPNSQDPVYANFRGVRPEAFLVHSQVRVTEGRAPGVRELLVGDLAAARMGIPAERLSVGRKIWWDDQEWTISGRFEAPGTVMEAEIWVPLQELRVATQHESLSCVVLTLEEPDFADAILFTKQRLDLELVAMPESVYYSKVFEFFEPVRVMVWITAILVAAGAFFGGLNTMYAAFSARVRELGALQAIGFERGAVLLSMVQESVLTAAAGSLLAAGFGLLVLDGLAVRVSMGAFGLVVDGTVMAIAMATGLLLGVAGALPPAWRCLSMPVSQSLNAA